jgi:carbon monoxide dehydrogenase subunit G
MAIHLENIFAVPVTLDRAWNALVDIPLVATCVPGASIEGQDSDGAYLGKVGLKLGPVAVEYHGRIEVVDRDDSSRVLSMRAEGKDARGQGNANATFTLEVQPDGATTTVRVLTDVDVTGRAAQFGRGIMEQVARRLVGQFSTNLNKRLSHEEPPVPGGTPIPTQSSTAVGRDLLVPISIGAVAGLVWLVFRGLRSRARARRQPFMPNGPGTWVVDQAS